MNTVADVIIVGGGPAGVAAAVELRRRGVKHVTIVDREPHLGGATRHCSHSPFGMREFGRVYFGAAYGRRLERSAAAAGVEVLTGHSVVSLGAQGSLTVTSPRGIETISAKRVVIATGARETPRSARFISGDRPVGVVTTGTLQSYAAFHGLMPFRRPLIVGSELVSHSALLTCLAHGARPVAMVEPNPYALARAPFTWFPRLAGIPFHCGAELIDIVGQNRVEAATIRLENGSVQTLACDGVLLTGCFTPESALLLRSLSGVAPGSAGPAIDQDGRMQNPAYFAGGNVLRAVETAGWSFREGRRVGAAVAEDLARGTAGEAPVAVGFDGPVKLVVPGLLRRNRLATPAFHDFQLRFERRVRGCLSLELNERKVWSRTGLWLPERRILVPIPPTAFTAESVNFRFTEES
ncbi:FAD/NAD(P)-binding oxidoreductase [Mesorhizobium sp. YR577]|uniref:NAD(P)/FAD-dependent oxidoreductase n=1 Tax=Mesorhizobium sp. YR577 TaxID=1884373 RepID=UPI0008EB0CC1|nr:FAD/NAD(P)-binding oxidoreductase [Mesorhizobium sp. YR577]SFT85262.1 Thioredoxin reductase [Mesorhizobium sp. YR577]